MKFAITATLCALALTTQPLAAQETGEAEAQAELAKLAEMFPAEPLTPEQEARLPAARALIDRILPPGSMGEMMNSMFGGMLEPLIALGIEPSADEIAEELGYEKGSFELSDEEAAEAGAILDPAWTERRKLEIEVMQTGMMRMMSAMEPAMRKGMTEAYAVHFSERELADIGVFFATPSGTAFAAKSYTLASDPRIMRAAMADMPAIMASMETLKGESAAATQGLPPRRGFNDLTAEQKERLAEMTGLTFEEIAAGLQLAAEIRAEEAAGD